jgi:hypothetical protein
MRRFPIIALVLIGWAMGFAADGMAATKPLKGIPLVWKPTSSASEYGIINLTGASGVKIELRALEDTREKPDLIGENRDKEDEGIVLPVTTSEKPAAFITEHLQKIFSNAGLNMVTTGGDAVVSGEVKRFFVLETSTYQAEVTLSITVKNGKGTLLWSGVAGGEAKRYGRSYKAENYYEALSDALMDAAYKLLQNEAFIKALAGKQ